MINQSYLKEILNYNPSTGLFTWKTEKRYGIKLNKIAGCNSHGYIAIKVNGKKYAAHRLAWLYVYGKFPNNMIDHINGIRHDNRIENLRDVTSEINQQNQIKPRSKNSSNFLGVNFEKNLGKWKAQIQANKVKKYLGLFETPELAYEAYLIAKRELHEGCTL